MNHLLNNPRYLAAARTCEKSGGAYTGWRPRERSSWPIVAVAIVVVLVALQALKWIVA